MKGYTTRDIAELLELDAAFVRQIARSGVLDASKTNGMKYSYTFQDIVILRTAKDLLKQGVSKTRMNQILYRLKYDLPSAGRPLTSLRIMSDRGEIVLKEKEGIFNPETGQYHFNFSVAELAGTVAPMIRKKAEEARHADTLTSDDWFDLGIDLEAVSPEDAPFAYMRALDLNPRHTDAHVNLGRLLQESGKYDEAKKHYLSALEFEPDNVLAAFNLGTLYEDLGQLQEAINAYTIAASFADAHYNLSRLYELLGQHQKALDHLKTYKDLIEKGHR